MKIKSLKYFMLLCKIWKKQWRISPLKKNAKTASRTRRGLLGAKKMHSILPCFSVEREERRWRALLASLHALVASITCCNHHHCHSHHCRHHHCHHHQSSLGYAAHSITITISTLHRPAAKDTYISTLYEVTIMTAEN